MPQLELAAKTADDELAKELSRDPEPTPFRAPEVPDGVDEHGNIVQRHLYGEEGTRIWISDETA